MQRKKDEIKGIANELFAVVLYLAATYAVTLFIMR